MTLEDGNGAGDAVATGVGVFVGAVVGVGVGFGVAVAPVPGFGVAVGAVVEGVFPVPTVGGVLPPPPPPPPQATNTRAVARTLRARRNERLITISIRNAALPRDLSAEIPA